MIWWLDELFTFSAANLISNTELERDADEEKIKLAYRRLAKFYHPDGMLLSPHPNEFQRWNLL